MINRLVAAGLILTAFCTIAFAQTTADPPAADQAASTQPDLPGADCDLRAAVALADSIVIAKTTDVDSINKTMDSREGKLGWAHLAVSSWLKGQVNNAAAAFVPVATTDDADIPRVPANSAAIMFLGHSGSSTILFKALADDDKTVAAINDLIKSPAPAPAAAPLRCDIVVSDPPANMAGTLLAALALTNTGDDPIRICVAGNSSNALTTDANQTITGSDVHFEAAKFRAAAPPDYELSRQIVTIRGKQTFLLAVGYAVPANGAITLTGHFSIPQELADKLDLWQGAIDAPPHTVFLNVPATQPAAAP
jgi:hypothetical protein